MSRIFNKLSNFSASAMASVTPQEFEEIVSSFACEQDNPALKDRNTVILYKALLSRIFSSPEAGKKSQLQESCDIFIDILLSAGVFPHLATHQEWSVFDLCASKLNDQENTLESSFVLHFMERLYHMGARALKDSAISSIQNIAVKEWFQKIASEDKKGEMYFSLNLSDADSRAKSKKLF